PKRHVMCCGELRQSMRSCAQPHTLIPKSPRCNENTTSSASTTCACSSDCSLRQVHSECPLTPPPISCGHSPGAATFTSHSLQNEDGHTNVPSPRSTTRSVDYSFATNS